MTRDVWSTIPDRPLRPWGSALSPLNQGTIVKPMLIGPTMKLRSSGRCKVCGERRFHCGCGEAA